MAEQRSQETSRAALDLFSGIGGFALGLERAGFPHCRLLREQRRLPTRASSSLAGSSPYSVWPFDLDTALPQRQRGRVRFIWLAHANRDREPRLAEHAEVAGLRALSGRREADHRPPLGMDDELPQRMDRLHALGNAITPDIAELIGRAIVRAS